MELNFFVNMPNWVSILLVILIVWDWALKLAALWKAGRNNQLVWFICIGIFNTIGILPIIYLLKNRNKE